MLYYPPEVVIIPLFQYPAKNTIFIKHLWYNQQRAAGLVTCHQNPFLKKFASGWENSVFFNPIFFSQWLKKQCSHSDTAYDFTNYNPVDFLHDFMLISDIKQNYQRYWSSRLSESKQHCISAKKETLTMISRVQVPPWPLTGLVLGSLEYKSWATTVNSPLVLTPAIWDSCLCYVCLMWLNITFNIGSTHFPLCF